MAETLLPPTFRKDPPYQVSYNYLDIADGTGMIQFYACGFNLSTGADYRLIQTPSKGAVNAQLMNAGILSETFDLSEFKKPRTIGGTAYISGYIYKNTANSHAVSVKFQKVSGATVTDLCSAVSSATTTTSGSWEAFSIVLDLTKTHFEAGDILRLYISGGGEELGTMQLNGDPSGDYPCTMYIPFKIEV